MRVALLLANGLKHLEWAVERMFPSDYTSRPAAYCGFTKDVYAFNSSLGEIGIDSINYRSFFLLYWTAFELPLKTAFDEAQNSSGFPDAAFLRVYGYWNLHWDEFNTQGEWPP